MAEGDKMIVNELQKLSGFLVNSMESLFTHMEDQVSAINSISDYLKDAEKKKKLLAHLEVEKKAIRSELGHNLSLKFTPTISFYLDESLDHAMRIENLLNQIHKDSPDPKEE